MQLALLNRKKGRNLLENQQDFETTDATAAAVASINSANTDNFSYGTPTADVTNNTIQVLATGVKDLAGEGSLGGCVNLDNGTVRITKTLSTTLTNVTAIPCA